MKREKPSPLFEIALVLVPLDHIARFIVNADHSSMSATLYFSALGVDSVSITLSSIGFSSLATIWPICKETY